MIRTVSLFKRWSCAILACALFFSGCSLRKSNWTPDTKEQVSTQQSDRIPTPAVTAALLSIERGTVDYKREDTWKQGADGDVLFAGDTVRTGANAIATVVFPDVGAMRLEENTKISIQTLSSSRVYLIQSVGDTYSKIKKLLGAESSYEVETPTAVATVRGTAFGVLVDRLKKTQIVVGESSVSVTPFQLVRGEKKRFNAVIVAEEQAINLDARLIERMSEKKEQPRVGNVKDVLIPKQREWFEERKKDQPKLEERIDRLSKPLQLRAISIPPDEFLRPTGLLPTSDVLAPLPIGEKLDLAKLMYDTFGCSSVDECTSICAKPENGDRCREIVQSVGMMISPLPTIEPMSVITPDPTMEVTPTPVLRIEK